MLQISVNKGYAQKIIMKKYVGAVKLVAVAAILSATLSACGSGIPTNYTGAVTLMSVTQTKYSFVVQAKLSNNKTYTANIGPAFKCIGLKKGMRLNVVKGAVRR